MIQGAISRLAPPIHIARRNLASSVLFTRTWENESVAELKRHVKVRGLSPKGRKATLIQKIQEHDKNMTNAFMVSRHSPLPVATRDMSTTPSQGVAPGIPSVTQALHNSRHQHFMVNIPDIPEPDPEFSVQVPYLPDFWDSSIAVGVPLAEEPLPKLLVVAGADTHHGGGPSHNLLDANLHEDVPSDAKSTPTAKIPAGQGKIWDDMAEDLGLPYLKEMGAGFWKSSL